MKLKFVNYKSDSSHVVLLPKIAFKYCNNYDGRIYTTIDCGEKSNINIVEKLIEQLTPFIIGQKNCVILNLLVNPFFEELCSYLYTKPKIGHRKIKFLKKHIFSYLCDQRTKRMYSDLAVEGAEIYIQKNMFEQSKDILEKL